jgi:hypothetical protein
MGTRIEDDSPMQKNLRQRSEEQHLQQIADRLEKEFGLSCVKSILHSRYDAEMATTNQLENCPTYFQAWLDGKKVFVKHGGYPGWCQREFELASQLNRINKDNFLEFFFYSEADYCRCVVSEFLDGEMLDTKVESADFTPMQRMFLAKLQ